MMKTKITALLLLACVATLGVVSCGESKPKPVSDNNENAQSAASQDSTIYGVCGEASAMNTLQLIADNGDTLIISTTEAQDAGTMFGGIAVGDRMAVIMPKGSSAALMVLNESTLLGDWVMPNPLDGTSSMGIRFKEGGVAESINHGAVLYKSWRLVNGQLEVVSVREGGGDFEETEYFQLLFLSADSLSYCDAEETFEYTRPQPEDDYSDLGIELDDGEGDEIGL